MTAFLTRLATFGLRHWLRLLIVFGAIFLYNRQQIGFNVRLGSPAAAPQSPAPGVVDPTQVGPAAAGRATPPTLMSDNLPAATAAAAPVEEPGFLDRFNLFSGSSTPSAYDELTRVEEETIAAFIRRFSNVAQTEQDKFGIPASITMANALLQSRAGTSVLAQNHNFFALPPGDEWTGDVQRHAGRAYRRYETAWTSFRDHSQYITSGRYAPMTQFGETDYQRWAAGLEELGFNDQDDLARHLTRTIDRYQLFRFD